MNARPVARRLMLLTAVLLLLPALAGTVRAADPATFTVGAFTFKRPPDWKWVPPTSSMRKAQLRVDGAGGQTAEVSFFHFGPGQGGDVTANVTRWAKQFDQGGKPADPDLAETTIKGTRITRVRVDSGTFNAGMPGGPTTPMNDYGLYGVILESPEGDVYVKMTGPAVLVKAAAADFDRMIQSPF